MTIAEITRGDMKIKVDVTPEDLVKIINGVSNTEDICIQVNHETLTLSKAKKDGMAYFIKVTDCRFFQ